MLATPRLELISASMVGPALVAAAVWAENSVPPKPGNIMKTGEKDFSLYSVELIGLYTGVRCRVGVSLYTGRETTLHTYTRSSLPILPHTAAHTAPERERERERLSPECAATCRHAHTHTVAYTLHRGINGGSKHGF